MGLVLDAQCRRESATFNHKEHIEHKAWDASAAGLEPFEADRAEVAYGTRNTLSTNIQERKSMNACTE